MALHPFETSGTIYRSTRRNTVGVLILHQLRNEKFKSRSLIILGLESNACNFLCHAVYDLDMPTFHTSPLQLFWRHYFSISILSTDFFLPSKICFPSSAATQSRRSEVPHHACNSGVLAHRLSEDQTKEILMVRRLDYKVDAATWPIQFRDGHSDAHIWVWPGVVKEAQHLWPFSCGANLTKASSS